MVSFPQGTKAEINQKGNPAYKHQEKTEPWQIWHPSGPPPHSERSYNGNNVGDASQESGHEGPEGTSLDRRDVDRKSSGLFRQVLDLLDLWSINIPNMADVNPADIPASPNNDWILSSDVLLL
jgi:hypothetical protein